MRTPVLLLAIAPLTACSGGGPAGPTGGTLSAGERVYREPLADGNSFTCSTCHALSEPAEDGFRRPGHPIGDAARRPHYKDGQLGELRDAVNTCVVEWMNADVLSADDPRWVDLEAFLQSSAPAAEAPPIDLRIVQPPADPTGGDALRGRETFNGACIVCHGRDAEGTVRAPALAGRELDPEYIATRVRLSGRTDSSVYEGLNGGVMPFWGADRLSDAELRDVVAFVMEVSQGGLPTGPVVPMDPPIDPPPAGGCDATHPRVGQVAELSTRFHEVSGTATIVDDCTIVIEGFTFDSRGIDVQVYAGMGGDYDGGFSISEDLLRGRPYEGETLTVTLPAGRTFDDLDGISIWCVPAGVSFGDGLFR